MTMNPLLPLSVLLALACPASAQEGARPARPTGAEDQAEADSAAYVQLQSVGEFSELVARDRRVSFAPRTVAAAVRELERKESGNAARAAALMALGAAHAVSERGRIESHALEAELEVRQAAILALGELHSSDLNVLLQLAGKRAAVASYALFALARSGAPAGLAAVQDIAGQAAHPLHAAAREALGFALDPPVESDVARAYFELRFDAARRFGLVDDQAWPTLLVEDLARDSNFLSRLVYRAAADLNRAGIKDHLLEVTLAGGAPERLRGVVAAMPTELSRMIEEDLYVPTDRREWEALLDEIERRGIEALCVPILRRAWTDPAARTKALQLLARARAPGALELVELGLRAADPAARAAAVHALAYAPSDKALPLLAGFEKDEDQRVQRATLVVQYRLGSEDASAKLREALDIDATQRAIGEASRPKAAPSSERPARGGRGGAGAEKAPQDAGAKAPDKPREGAKTKSAEDAPKLTPYSREALQWVEALLPAAADRRVRDLLAVARARTPDALRQRVDTELAWHGDARSRAALRDVLRRQRPSGAAGARAVMALGRGAGLADIELLRELFPLGDEPEVDVELALALIAAREAAVLPLLRAAVWSEPWNRSVLAGALVLHHGGIEALRAEVARPPAGINDRDLRRVGFALGEWGGAVEVDRLAGRVSAADPALQGALLGALSTRSR